MIFQLLEVGNRGSSTTQGALCDNCQYLEVNLRGRTPTKLCVIISSTHLEPTEMLTAADCCSFFAKEMEHRNCDSLVAVVQTGQIPPGCPRCESDRGSFRLNFGAMDGHFGG